MSPPIGALLPGARVSLAVIGSPARSDALTSAGSSFCSRAFCSGVAGGVDPRVVRRAELRGQLAVVLARIFAGAGEDLGGQQVEDRAVLVGRPDGAVAPQEAGAGALLAAEAERAVEQPGREPLEADRHLAERPVQAGDHAIDQAAADQRLADLACAGQSGRWVSR